MANVRFLKDVVPDFPGFADAWSAYKGEMHRKGWESGWPAHPRFTVFGIIKDDELISFLMTAELNDGIVKVGGAWTHPIYRRRGIYEQLFGLAVNYYRSQGDEVWLHSGYRTGNIPSATFQKKQGREIIEQIGETVRTRITLVPQGDEFPMNSTMLQGIMDILEPEALVA